VIRVDDFPADLDVSGALAPRKVTDPALVRKAAA
jgi:hypothetical protein